MSSSSLDGLENLPAANRGIWRRWLSRHHATSPGVWLVLSKRGSGVPGVSMEEAVEEALCFGWIDSRMRPIDADTYRVVFSPRRPGSIWSANNKRRVERLIRDGLMTEAGLATIERAKADWTWTSLDAVEALEMPEDLSTALDAAPPARSNFDAYPASTRRLALHHVNSAKRPATRARRIAELVRLAEENRRPFQAE